jgi:hypothetical protein
MKKKFFTVALATTMALSSVGTAFAVDAKDTISGDLTVTTFFNEKTDAVELKSGESLTFTFKETSNGTANYENYVMAVTGAIGDAYTGAEQEVLIVRADAWGWGGGMSDILSPDTAAATGNNLVFESDVDWDAWASAMASGVDCTVTIARDGNKLDYTAKVGNYTISTSTTSGKDLPDSCYVFFTGEKCVLSGITCTKKEAGSVSNSDSPEAATTAAPTEATTAAATATTAAAKSEKVNSGDVAPIAALAAVAVVACAGVVVSRKKVTE